MGWFSKSSGGRATPKDADALRDALVKLLRHVEGELPRADAQRVQELIERLGSYPVPTGTSKQAAAVVKALRGTAVGSGSADFADAARALVAAIQRVSIHDTELTKAISKVEKGIPLRVRNGDARLIEANAQELQQSASAARFRQAKADEAVLSLMGALEVNLGKALAATSGVEAELASLRAAVVAMQPDASFEQVKAGLLTTLDRASDGHAIARSRIDQGVARSRELMHHVKSQTGDVGGRKASVSVDGLTNVADIGSFREALPLALVEARHSGGLLTCMRFNVDKMSEINEVYHRTSGDDVLRTVAVTIVKQLRTEDFVARLNDDNFAALLPNTGNREAIGAAKRLGRKIQKMVFSHQSKSFQVSLSIGIATWDGRESAESLFSRSEEALSNAKRAGGAQYWTAQTLQQE
ncbi:MAG: diguanylate cyclase [Myxococcota bacterium]|nr:diguanylate cyclase [Myxococcota bacterium]